MKRRVDIKKQQALALRNRKRREREERARELAEEAADLAEAEAEAEAGQTSMDGEAPAPRLTAAAITLLRAGQLVVILHSHVCHPSKPPPAA